MGDFLDNLVDRSLHVSADMKPRSPSLYEPLANGPHLVVPIPTHPGEDHSEHDVEATVSEHPSKNIVHASDAERASNPVSEIFNRVVQTTQPTELFQKDTAGLTGRLAELEQKLQRLTPIERHHFIKTETQLVTDRPTILGQSFVDSNGGEVTQSSLTPGAVRIIVQTQKPGESITPIPDDVSGPIANNDSATEKQSPRRQSGENVVVQQTNVQPAQAPPPITTKRAAALQSPEVSSIDFRSPKPPPVAAPAPTIKRRESTTPTVTVTIGRIELRGTETPSQPASTTRRKEPPSRVMSLEQYLQLRSQGSLS
jgi:hypothetical protein